MRESLCLFLADFNELTTFMASLERARIAMEGGNYGRHPRLSTPGSRSAQEALAAVEQKHRNDDDAVDHLAAELLNLHHLQNRLQERDQDHAGDGAEIGAAAAEDRGSAEDDGGDRLQEVGIAHRLRRPAGI